MKHIWQIFSTLILFLSFVACEDNIEFNEKESNPFLVTHVIAIPDSTLYAQVTKSVFFLKNTSDPLKDADGNYLGVRDAVVKLYVNNEFKENMVLVSGDSGIYKANYIPQENEQIKVVISSPAFEQVAEGKTTLPKKITMTVDTTIQYYEGNGGYSYGSQVDITYDTVQYKKTNYTIHFTDDGSQENYYAIELVSDFAYTYEEISMYSPDTTNVPIYITSEDETLFSGFAQDNKLIFEDKKINGQTYSLSFYSEEMVNDSTYTNYMEPKKTRLKFYSLNKDAYLFMTSCKKNYETSGMSIFSEPSQVYSNIKNGIGIIGGFSVAVKEY